MSLHPKIIDLTLGRMHRILAALGNPERSIPPVIHIAGTNGKGSTQAMLRAGLEGDGARVHAYTSPHLAQFHERIRVAGSLIGEDDLAGLLAECETANGSDTITFFEITTAAAFLAFSRTPADYTLLEVGLGGRLDATNVVTPTLSVITPVALDHQQYLGDTHAEIAAEKAGILKTGVPCIVAEQTDEALEVIEARAREVGAPLSIQNRDWQVWEERGSLVFQDQTGLEQLPLPNLIGAHQVGNAGTAIAALRTLGRGNLTAAVTKAEWPARLQRLRRGPLVELAGRAELWLDGGHNPAAGIALAEALTRLPQRPLYLICGILKSKDATGFLRPFSAAEAVYAVTVPGEIATMAAAETAAAAEAAGISATEAGSVGAAVAEIADKAPNARILICGSLYLAGNILRANG